MSKVIVLSRRGALLKGLCQGAFNEGTEIELATDLTSLLEPARTEDGWLLIVDAPAIECEDLATLELIKAHRPECRILLVFSIEQRALASQAVRHGVDAYILDPFSLEEFSAIARRLGGQVTDAHQRAQAYRMDVLTIFLRGLSHELLNPLTTISGILQLLMHPGPEGEDPKDLSRKYTIMADGVSRISTLLKELEYFIRVRRAERGLVSLLDILEESTRAAREAYGAPPNEDDLPCQVPASLPKILLDRDQMVFALTNIIRYAMRASGRPEAVRIDAELDHENKVAIQVSAEGQPLWPEDLDRIFVPFYSRTGRDFAEGLSLSAAYGIVRGHNGTVRVEPVDEERFRITVSLPTGESEIRTPPS